ncbi:MAG: hypothetical protein RL318_1548 [Fibrobacterota bacterium]|jgi:urease accessory protein
MRKILLLPVFAATAAFAHPGHGGMASGLLHPLTGLDHLMVMVAIGVLAAHRSRHGASLWTLPAVFAASLGAGAMLPMAGVVIPMAETVILASLALFAGLLIARWKAPLGFLLPVAALAGVCHGFAHGAEAQGGLSVGFLAGCVAMTALLHAAGAVMALRFGSRQVRLAWGGLTALVAVALVLS